ncbi:hypothetical protein [Halovenus marina]|uniref:hypothetical protein n=1 Tax=Halovenus marina TaxID=3396621 RepID=UPI003F55E570
MSDQTARQRIRSLSRKLTSSPTLPLLGWTKAVETIVATGPTRRWAAYAGLVTLLWVYADQLSEAADGVSDAVEEATDD